MKNWNEEEDVSRKLKVLLANQNLVEFVLGDRFYPLYTRDAQDLIPHLLENIRISQHDLYLYHKSKMEPDFRVIRDLDADRALIEFSIVSSDFHRLSTMAGIHNPFLAEFEYRLTIRTVAPRQSLSRILRGTQPEAVTIHSATPKLLDMRSFTLNADDLLLKIEEESELVNPKPSPASRYLDSGYHFCYVTLCGKRCPAWLDSKVTHLSRPGWFLHPCRFRLEGEEIHVLGEEKVYPVTPKAVRVIEALINAGGEYISNKLMLDKAFVEPVVDRRYKNLVKSKKNKTAFEKFTERDEKKNIRIKPEWMGWRLEERRLALAKFYKDERVRGRHFNEAAYFDLMRVAGLKEGALTWPNSESESKD